MGPCCLSQPLCSGRRPAWGLLAVPLSSISFGRCDLMNFLDQLRRNPHGWGSEPEEPGYLEMAGNAAVNTGHAATNLLKALAHGFSPIDENYNLQTPPIVSDAWTAINAPGKALWEGMDNEEINRTAAVAAGLAMTCGLVAPKNALARRVPEHGHSQLLKEYHEANGLPPPDIVPQQVFERQDGPYPGFEEYQPDTWIQNQRADEIASRSPTSEGDFWQAWNDAGGYGRARNASDDLQPRNLDSGRTGFSALPGAERLVTPNGINLDYSDILRSLDRGTSTLHANGSGAASTLGILEALAQEPSDRMNFLDQLYRNPRGWGNLPPLDPAHEAPAPHRVTATRLNSPFVD